MALKEKFCKNIFYLIILDICTVLALVFAPFVSNVMLLYLPDCWVARHGFLCPACGTTRCVNALFDGKIYKALTLNPISFFLIIYLAVLILLLNITLISNVKPIKKIVKGMVHPIAVICFAIAFAVFGILRNFI